MSVSNPVDSGGGFTAFDRDLQGLADQMNTVGGWAAIMDQDSVNNTIDEEEQGRDEEDGRKNSTKSQSENSDPVHRPPYAIQVLNLPVEVDPDELYLFLGGDEKIEHIDVKKHGNRAFVTFKTAEYMTEYLNFGANGKKYGTQTTLRFYKLPNGNHSEHIQESFSRSNSCQQSRDSYSHYGSNYGSTTSLASSHYGGQGRRYDHSSARDYQTMPPPGRYGRDDRGMRGGNRKSFRGDHHGSYDRRNNYVFGGEIQRSESYSYDKERPAPINRSRTEDGLADRRQSDLLSRTSSQYSVNRDESKPVVKKPSTKDIFGDAKPADTAQKLKELEERAEKKKEAEKQAERNQLQQLQMQQQMSQLPPQMPYGCAQIYQHSPGNYVQYNPPSMQFITPTVNLPGGPRPQHYMHTSPAYPSDYQPSYYGGPGSVKIAQRPEVDVNANSNVSPPQDPEHTKQNVTQTSTPVVHPINTIKEELPLGNRRPSASQENNKMGGSAVHTHEKPKPFVRTFNNSAHKSGSYDGNRGNRGGRGGYSRGRGGGSYHASKTDSTVAPRPEPEENINKESSLSSHVDNAKDKKNKSKDIHGSQASLNSRGVPRGGGVNRGRGRGNFKNRPMRDDRTPREDGQKSEMSREAKPYQQRKPSKGEGQKVQNAASAPSKPEQKDEAKQPVAVVKAEPAAPAAALENKEKKKKKKANPTKNLTPLNNNKFAALANDTGDE